jgi:hypothetical protein
MTQMGIRLTTLTGLVKSLNNNRLNLFLNIKPIIMRSKALLKAFNSRAVLGETLALILRRGVKVPFLASHVNTTDLHALSDASSEKLVTDNQVLNPYVLNEPLIRLCRWMLNPDGKTDGKSDIIIADPASAVAICINRLISLEDTIADYVKVVTEAHEAAETLGDGEKFKAWQGINLDTMVSKLLLEKKGFPDNWAILSAARTALIASVPDTLIDLRIVSQYLDNNDSVSGIINDNGKWFRISQKVVDKSPGDMYSDALGDPSVKLMVSNGDDAIWWGGYFGLQNLAKLANKEAAGTTFSSPAGTNQAKANTQLVDVMRVMTIAEHSLDIARTLSSELEDATRYSNNKQFNTLLADMIRLRSMYEIAMALHLSVIISQAQHDIHDILQPFVMELYKTKDVEQDIIYKAEELISGFLKLPGNSLFSGFLSSVPTALNATAHSITDIEGVLETRSSNDNILKLTIIKKRWLLTQLVPQLHVFLKSSLIQNIYARGIQRLSSGTVTKSTVDLPLEEFPITVAQGGKVMGKGFSSILDLQSQVILPWGLNERNIYQGLYVKVDGKDAVLGISPLTDMVLDYPKFKAQIKKATSQASLTAGNVESLITNGVPLIPFSIGLTPHERLLKQGDVRLAAVGTLGTSILPPKLHKLINLNGPLALTDKEIELSGLDIERPSLRQKAKRFTPQSTEGVLVNKLDDSSKLRLSYDLLIPKAHIERMLTTDSFARAYVTGENGAKELVSNIVVLDNQFAAYYDTVFYVPMIQFGQSTLLMTVNMFALMNESKALGLLSSDTDPTKTKAASKIKTVSSLTSEDLSSTSIHYKEVGVVGMFKSQTSAMVDKSPRMTEEFQYHDGILPKIPNSDFGKGQTILELITAVSKIL